ncbi:MAG: bifunctional DNA-formamidopyrimidine glycosylase/DNA-(apurinic or apyrimidinic site) lyase [Pseudomonadota bacterium]
MPELPEVETTRRGIAPHITNQTVKQVIVREPRLRWPVPDNLDALLIGQAISEVTRRGKYILADVGSGCLLMHLGMSGNLRVLPIDTPLKKHDHVDIVFDNEQCLRYHDPRRFGSLLWVEKPVLTHPLLAKMGPEPLGGDFDGDHLYQQSRGRTGPIKNFIMDGHIVVGVGNIYANEALFLSGIRPDRAAGRVSRPRYHRLAENIKKVLSEAIKQGGTTLRDFTGAGGAPGYFKQYLRSYTRKSWPQRMCL